jgi:hypothetical protein
MFRLEPSPRSIEEIVSTSLDEFSIGPFPTQGSTQGDSCLKNVKTSGLLEEPYIFGTPVCEANLCIIY